MYKKFCFFIASLFGVGYAPVASGTFGSLAAMPLAYFFRGELAWLAAALFLIGWAASREVLRHTSHDPSLIVIDEAAGVSIALLPAVGMSVGFWVAGFLLFRFFDIVKPFPVGWVDRRVNNAFGVMFDDVLAGIMAAACLKTACIIF